MALWAGAPRGSGSGALSANVAPRGLEPRENAILLGQGDDGGDCCLGDRRTLCVRR